MLGSVDQKSSLRLGDKLPPPELHRLHVMSYRSFLQHSTRECEHMEDAKSGHPGPFTLSASGRASVMWSQWLGDFILTKKQHGGRPVYRNSKGKHLYSLESGAWAVSVTVGNCSTVTVLQSTEAKLPPPALPSASSGSTGMMTVMSVHGMGMMANTSLVTLRLHAKSISIQAE